MGWEVDWFLDDELASAAVCIICSNVVEDPIQCPCTDVFCSACIKSSLLEINVCPSCEKPLSEDQLQPVHRFWKISHDNLRVYCPLDGCTGDKLLHHLPDHIKFCNFRKEECPNEGCTFTSVVESNLLASHMKVCRFKGKFGLIEEVAKNEKAWPTARHMHCMCADENFLYLFGGSGGGFHNDLWRYNVTTENWVLLPDNAYMAPSECCASAMLLWQRKLVVFGGFGGDGYVFSNKLYVYCLQTYRWLDLNEKGEEKWDNHYLANSTSLKPDCECRAIHCKNPPPARMGHSMALCEKTDDIFIFSGFDNDEEIPIEDLHRFNLYSLTWDRIQFCSKHSDEAPSGRSRHGVVWNQNGFFIFGGFRRYAATPERCGGSQHLSVVAPYSFDFENLLWKEHMAKSAHKIGISESGEDQFLWPDPRKCSSFVIYKKNVYIAGGFSFYETGLSDIWKYYLGDEHVIRSERAELPWGISFHASAVTSRGCMYVFGGDKDYRDYCADLLMMWLEAPSLKEQAWMKILESLKSNNIELTKEVLTELGVPEEFHSRVDDSCLPAYGDFWEFHDNSFDS